MESPFAPGVAAQDVIRSAGIILNLGILTDGGQRSRYQDYSAYDFDTHLVRDRVVGLCNSDG